MKKAISLILTFAMLLSVLSPMSVSAATNDDYIILEVTAEKTSLKEKYYANSQTIETAYRGDLLYAVDAETNKHGNLWYRVLWADSEKEDVGNVYAYSGEVSIHCCEFIAHKVSESRTLHYCRCGQIQLEQEGMTSQGSDTLAITPTGILSPKDIDALLAAVAAARGYVQAAGTAASGVLQALANPYVLVPVLIAGAVVYIALTCDGRSIAIDHVKENYRDYSNSEFRDGVYYCALVLPDTKQVLFLTFPGTEMDLNGAKEFMILVAQFTSAYKIEKTVTDNTTETFIPPILPMQKNYATNCSGLGNLPMVVIPVREHV